MLQLATDSSFKLQFLHLNYYYFQATMRPQSTTNFRCLNHGPNLRAITVNVRCFFRITTQHLFFLVLRCLKQLLQQQFSFKLSTWLIMWHQFLILIYSQKVNDMRAPQLRFLDCVLEFELCSYSVIRYYCHSCQVSSSIQKNCTYFQDFNPFIKGPSIYLG